MLDVPDIRLPGLSLLLVDTDKPKIKITGNGDADAVRPLETYFRRLHKELSSSHFRSVHVDLEEMFFMNSSCLKAFVSWIHRVDSEGGKYTIELLMNPRLPWQKRSLATLQRLAPRVVSISELQSASPPA